MGVQDLVLTDNNNLFFNEDNFFNETVIYKSYNPTDQTYSDTQIRVIFDRNAEQIDDDYGGSKADTAILNIRTEDINTAKYQDQIIDSDGHTWTLQKRMGLLRGIDKWFVTTDEKIKVK